MWWIVFALVLICVVERNILDDPNSGVEIWNILFEVVSAYGTVGLSLGAPGQNYSLSGAFRPLSKLILCAVMIRGRHRGLPVAIDRAVMLPHEFHRREDGSNENDDNDLDTQSESTHEGQTHDEVPSSTLPHPQGNEPRPQMAEQRSNSTPRRPAPPPVISLGRVASGGRGGVRRVLRRLTEGSGGVGDEE